MGVVRVVDQSLSGASSVIYSLPRFGARSVTVQLQEETQGNLTITALDATGALETVLAVLGMGANQGEHDVVFGFPCLYERLKFAQSAAGAHTARLVFSSEVIAPFGRVPLFGSAVALGAGASTIPYPLQVNPLIVEVGAVMVSTRPASLLLLQQLNGVSNLTAPMLGITGATGGGGFSARVPCGPMLGFTIRNDDAANGNSVSWNAWGYLG